MDIFTGDILKNGFFRDMILSENYCRKGMFLREPKSAYLTKSQGDYTLDDYYLIPDDMRVELIDGVIYDMTAPTSAHQLIAGFIYSKLLGHVLEKRRMPSYDLASGCPAGLR